MNNATPGAEPWPQVHPGILPAGGGCAPRAAGL